jgi:UDP-N-acetylglucosamine acyltransferase
VSVEHHPTAVISLEADLGNGTVVGPYAVVGEGVNLGPDCEVMAHAVLEGPLTTGRGCRFFPFASVGSIPQDLKYRGERTELVIGEENTFREFVTINRGTAGGGGTTRVGSHNLFMAYTHVAHDCTVGDRTVFGNAATLAGHVVVEDDAIINAFSGIHQYCRVGKHAFIGGYSVITQDALPYIKSVGNRASTYGVNTIGLRRKGLSEEAVNALKRAYRILFQSSLNTSQAMEKIETEIRGCEEVAYLLSFIRSSERGVVK